MDELAEEPRYIVGIDLGTTNCAVSYVDTLRSLDRVKIFQVPQLVAPDMMEARDTLPSFHYQPAENEFTTAALTMPWGAEPESAFVGVLARDHGVDVPGRQIASAKSWLCHGGVDRTAAILPWQGAEDITRFSPSDVCAAYLRHIRLAWNHAFPTQPMEQQDVVITVPASFDEIARELTVKAAAAAGLPRIVLVEEPLAAFYNWLQLPGEEVELPEGSLVLVCDVGGGTSDFSLIEVRKNQQGALQFHRMAVGDHLILGGDNLDLTLARFVEQQLGKGALTARQYSGLLRRCRYAKEVLLGANPPDELTLNISSGGSRLVGSTIQYALQRADAVRILVDGFLPSCSLQDNPVIAESGFREFGLPFAPDPAIPRYLARFLREHGRDGAVARPDAILFNGGFFASSLLRQRLLKVMQSWFGAGWNPHLLKNERLDLAVAQGAASYGRVRRGTGEKIKAGIPRSYYIGVNTGASSGISALCLVPAGLEEGVPVRIDQADFEIRIREPVEFPIYCSALRTEDHPGDLVVPDPESITALPPIRTVLRSGKKKGRDRVVVQLRALVSETGTLQLFCQEKAGDRSWQLLFDVRSATQTDKVAHEGAAETQGFVDEETVLSARRAVADTFSGDAAPERLPKLLEQQIDLPRAEWPTSLLRSLWEELMLHEQARQRTPQHESRWLNLVGFCLRPGYGFAVDDWRVARMWRLSQSRVFHPRNEQCCGDWWILWRRISGGLSANQQQELAKPLIAAVKAQSRGRKSKTTAGPHEAAEIWRLLGALERLEPAQKEWLGAHALAAVQKQGAKAWSRAAVWALARMGCRQPVYGPLNTLVSPECAETWCRKLLQCDVGDSAVAFALMQLGRKTDDRFRDISAELREEIAESLTRHAAAEHYVRLLREAGSLQRDEMTQVLGDELPPGLSLCN